jgi:hypothetical protein
MANLYRNSFDKWRAYGYQKAISTLKKCHRPVTTYEVYFHRYFYHRFQDNLFRRKFECYRVLVHV